MTPSEIIKYAFIGLIVVVACGVGYGLYHDFTPEYEAAVPVQYDMIVYDAHGNEVLLGDTKHSRGKQNYIIQGDKVIALTPLDEEGLKIQAEKGCIACHPK